MELYSYSKKIYLGRRNRPFTAEAINDYLRSEEDIKMINKME
jgi:hypothetical protein